jgi:hypothetical protein
MILAMVLVSPTKLSDEEKLETLQRLDRFRQWHSLDEKRYCLVCGKIITGREIQVIWHTWKRATAHRLSDGTLSCDSDGLGSANR